MYGKLHGDASDYSVQVLSITKAGCGGVQNLNMAFHNEFRTLPPLVYSYDRVHGMVGAQTLERVPLRVGDLVMYTENDYSLGLRNGSLGMMVEGFKPTDAESACCVCEFDGQRYTLNSRQTNALRTHIRSRYTRAKAASSGALSCRSERRACWTKVCGQGGVSDVLRP